MTTARTALVIGAAGQDGSYLTELLLGKGYDVVGVVRRAEAAGLTNLEHVLERIDLVTADLADTEAIVDAVATYEPDELYNFASVSFGPDAWDDPIRTVELGGLAIARLLEGLRAMRAAPVSSRRRRRGCSAGPHGRRRTNGRPTPRLSRTALRRRSATSSSGDIGSATICTRARASSTTTSRRADQSGS